MPYDSMDILKYLDGRLDYDKTKELEKYLQSRPELLAETLELNRINAVMEAGTPEPLPADAFILVEFIGEMIRRFEAPDFEMSTQQLLSTRSRKTAGQSLKAENKQYSIEIIPSYEGSFWISLQSSELQNTYVSLARPSDDFPIFSKKVSDKVTIKGVAPGHYHLSFLQKRIDIQIQNTDNY